MWVFYRSLLWPTSQLGYCPWCQSHYSLTRPVLLGIIPVVPPHLVTFISGSVYYSRLLGTPHLQYSKRLAPSILSDHLSALGEPTLFGFNFSVHCRSMEFMPWGLCTECPTMRLDRPYWSLQTVLSFLQVHGLLTTFYWQTSSNRSSSLLWSSCLTTQSFHSLSEFN